MLHVIRAASNSFTNFLLTVTHFFPVASFRTVFLLIAVGLAISCQATSQSNEWAWWGGATFTGAPGIAGTQGVAAATNLPAARTNSVTWADASGNLWLYGGFGVSSGTASGSLSDLWKYDPSAKLWTWVGGEAGTINVLPVYGTMGTPAATNTPGGRFGAVSWTDTQGNLWLFGGTNGPYIGGTVRNDLWKLDATTHAWTWIDGPNSAGQSGVYGAKGTPSASNFPGARTGSVAWTDQSGNFWLFGGDGVDASGQSGALSDLWKFNPSSGQWSWINGPNSTQSPAVSGTLQVPAPDNVPGPRWNAVGWADPQGSFWLFGGNTKTNDLWKYDPAINQWAWMGGDLSITPYTSGSKSVYGELQVSAAGNTPGARNQSVGWTDKSGNLWLFGGLGTDANYNTNELNDLWQFNPNTKLWTWMGGSSVADDVCPDMSNWCGQMPTYDTLYSPGLGVVPSGRYGSQTWTDSKGSFWLMGGDGIGNDSYDGVQNDLWLFQPNSNGQPIAATPEISPTTGSYNAWQQVTISSSTPGASVYYTLGDFPPTLTYSGPITLTSSRTIHAIAAAPGYSNSNIATASFALSLPAASSPTFSIAPGTYATAQTVALSSTTPGAVIYYAIGNLLSAPLNTYTGPITVSTTETIQAYAIGPDYGRSATSTGAYHIGTIPSPSNWSWMGGLNAVSTSCYTLPAGYTVSCYLPAWHGTKGVAAAGNTPGGRNAPLFWQDASGNFWMFGGYTTDSTGTGGFLSDLWKFDPSTNFWTWMGGEKSFGSSCASSGIATGCGTWGVYGTRGVAAATNLPGGRQWSVNWTDKNGHFWLFGGIGYDANGLYGLLNDLWEFDPATNLWTWRKGGSGASSYANVTQPGVYGNQGVPTDDNTPGARNFALHWIGADGHLWLYGGEGSDYRGLIGYENDLWEYNPSTNQWTWWNGHPYLPDYEAGWNPIDTYYGLPAPDINPGSRSRSETWTDSTGRLWLYGGYATDIYAVSWPMADLWSYDISIHEWTKFAAGNGYPTYGTLGVPNINNTPARPAADPSWTDADGNFWLMTTGKILLSSAGNAHDLWWLSPATQEWTWMGGSSNEMTISGTLGVPAAANAPSRRTGGAAWTASDGSLWLYGGSGFDANYRSYNLGDMWRYGASDATVAPPAMAAAPSFSLATGAYSSVQTLTLSDTTPGATIYYTLDGNAPNSTSSVYKSPIAINASVTVQAQAAAANFANSPIANGQYTLTLPATATPTFTPAAGTYTSAQSIAIADATAGAIIYYTTDGTTPTTSSTVYSSPIAVSTSVTLSAMAIASGYASSPVATAAYVIQLPPSFTLSTTPSSLSMAHGTQSNISLTVTPQNGFSSVISFSCSGLPAATSCSFSPASVTPAGLAATSTLTIVNTASAANRQPSPFTALPPATLAILAGLFLRRRKFRFLTLLLVLTASCAMAVLTSCSGGSSGGGTTFTPVSGAVTITATSATVQQTATVTLNIN